MPELPEVEVLCEYFQPRLVGRVIEKVGISPRFGFLLRTPPADLAAKLEGQKISRIWRRGKFFTLDTGDRHLVVNPMLGGRLHWATSGTKAPAALFSLRLSGGDVLSLTDFARMARVYLVEGDGFGGVPGWAELGPEADQVGAEEFAARIRRHPGELKNLLRNQAFIAGIGNAYSDEILHEARMLPLRKRSTLKSQDIQVLHAAVGTVLTEATGAIRAQPAYQSHKQDRSFMKVHLRGGQACPRCGHRIAELTARGEVTSYCRGCQE